MRTCNLPHQCTDVCQSAAHCFATLAAPSGTVEFNLCMGSQLLHAQAGQRTAVCVQEGGIVAIQRDVFARYDEHGDLRAVLARHKDLQQPPQEFCRWCAVRSEMQRHMTRVGTLGLWFSQQFTCCEQPMKGSAKQLPKEVTPSHAEREGGSLSQLVPPSNQQLPS